MSRKQTVLKPILLACVVLAMALASPARAGDDNTIAGVLSGNPGCNVYSFDSSGGQILFAEAAAEFYQSRGRSNGGGCDHEESTLTETASVLEGSCTDEGSDGGCTDGGSSVGCSGDDGSTHDEGGCSCGDSTAGPNDLCLQVVDFSGNKICWAGRPIRPGWQRDPRLACHLPQEGEYYLRVFRGQCGSTTACGETVASGASGSSPTYYLLRARLVDVEESEGRLFPPPKGD